MDLNDAKLIAETAQAVVLSLAAIITGIWAAYRFRALGELEKARQDLANSAASLTKAQAEYEVLRRSLEHRGTLNISLSSRAGTDPTIGLYVEVNISMSNVGNRLELLEWQRGRISIAPVISRNGTTAEFGAWTDASLVRWEGESHRGIPPGATESATFVLMVPSPGLYFVRFTIPGSARSLDETAQEIRLGVKELQWQADTTVLVAPGQLAGTAGIRDAA